MHSRKALSLMAGAAAALFLLALPARAAPFFPLVDPIGDTFGPSPQLDITTYGATVDLSQAIKTTTFTVNFAGPIAPASALAANSLSGFIDIDLDRNPATGGNAPWGMNLVGGNNWINFFIPPNPGLPNIPGPLIATGDELYVDLGSELFHPGLVDVIDTNTALPVLTVPITFTPTSFTVVLPIVGTTTDKSLNFDLLVGNLFGPTDRAPNGAVPATSTVIPEPGSLLLFGVTLLVAFRRARRRGE